MSEANASAAQAASPDFVDAAGARAWLSTIPLANVAASQMQILLQVEELNRFQTKGGARLAVLEELREAVHFVQIEQAKRFVNRAMPFADSEAAIFVDTIALWDQMRIGYHHCIEAAVGGDPSMRGKAALACQRALAYAGLKMFHYCRAYREPPSTEWRLLHRCYVTAEKLGVAEEPVKDYLNRDVQDSSPRISYMRGALFGMVNPNELSQRQLTFIAYMLERWAEKVEFLPPEATPEEVPPLRVDLGGGRAPTRDADGMDAASEPRLLDARRLTKSLRNRIALLRKGESPARLGLGEDCVQPACEALLVFLYRQWCQPRGARGNEIPAIHYYISGQVFRQPGDSKELSKKARDEIATFGRVSTRDEDDYSVARGFLLEHWEVEDESVQGLRIVRRAGNPGKRYAHGQLVCVRPADTKNFLLAQVRWLLQSEAGDLHAGLKLLPGLAGAVTIRGTGVNAVHDRWQPALSLSAVPALNSPPALVLPSGWFKPKRVIDVWLNGAFRVHLLEILERGSDFERLSYEVIR
jgi:hypothetical protein